MNIAHYIIYIYKGAYTFSRVQLQSGPIQHDIAYSTPVTDAEQKSEFVFTTDPPIWPSGASYEVSVVRNLEKTDRVITALYYIYHVMFLLVYRVM